MDTDIGAFCNAPHGSDLTWKTSAPSPRPCGNSPISELCPGPSQPAREGGGDSPELQSPAPQQPQGPSLAEKEASGATA